MNIPEAPEAQAVKAVEVGVEGRRCSWDLGSGNKHLVWLRGLDDMMSTQKGHMIN